MTTDDDLIATSDGHEVVEMGGLHTTKVLSTPSSRLVVVFLHGYAMGPEALVPFARSLGAPATFYFPQGPLPASPTGWAWWPIDAAARERSLAVGPRDLADEHPTGAGSARRILTTLLGEVRRAHPKSPIVLAGFSQGGMLACDLVLRSTTDISGLMLLSSSRISADEWEPLIGRLRDLPTLVSHGRRDHDLAFHAGEALRDQCERGGAPVTWIPFDGGHEIPLPVWRGIRRFLKGIRGN